MLKNLTDGLTVGAGHSCRRQQEQPSTAKTSKQAQSVPANMLDYVLLK